MGDNYSDRKRVKEDIEDPIILLNHAKEYVKDLKFIVQHLKRDIVCTIESGQKAVKLAIEREIGVLVFSMTEESVKEISELKDRLYSVEQENSLLIDNEEAMMEELARLTLKKEKEPVQQLVIGSITEELAELELIITDNMDLSRIKEKLQGNQELESTLSAQSARIAELEGILTERDQVIFNMKAENDDLNIKLTDSTSTQSENESRFRELMTMNCELMDLGESSKAKETELSKENARLNNELESMKKIMTAHKIEMEKNREILNRERKLFALKISDLQEQIDELRLESENCDLSNADTKLKGC